MKYVVVPGILGVTLMAASVVAASELPPAAEGLIDYHKDIAPIFEAHCVKCHGAEKQKSEYRLDSRNDAITSGSEGAAIVPGNSAESLLVRLIAGIDENFDIMPPKGDPLTPEQIGVIRAWIDQGAVWDESGSPSAGSDKQVFAGLGESWFVEATGQKGPLATWELVDEKGPAGEACVALTKGGSGSADTFNLLWDTKTQFKNGELTVALKSVSGEAARGGGILWRAQDKDNYYAAQFNPVAKKLSLIQVKDGSHEKLGSADVESAEGVWASLTVAQAGNAITVSLDGKALITAESTTFPEAGGVGLWTKGDAATVFTRLAVAAK